MANRICPAAGRRFLTALLVIAFAVALSMYLPSARAEAACTVPNQITNGQVADATVVMSNFNGLKDCVDTVANSTVTPSGSPSTGNLPVFSSGKTITNGDLSGDCTTSGSLAVTCTKTNGTPLGYYATGTDAGQLTGTISVQRFANGANADNTHFLRGDGVWAVPSGTGGGGGTTATTPTIRATSIASFNASSVTIPWPAGTVAGDLVIIFVSDGYAVNSPTGWTILNNTGPNDWADGLTAAKLMTSADITAGSATITLVGPYNGVAAAVTVDGSTFTHVREVTALRSGGSASYSSAAIAGMFTAADTDLILGFTYIRGAMNPTISNFTQLQQLNAANASGFLGKYALVPTKLGLSETATYPSGNNGYYWSLVALR
jgi:hypothetical protein